MRKTVSVRARINLLAQFLTEQRMNQLRFPVMSYFPSIVQLIARRDKFNHGRRVRITMRVLLPFFLSSSLLGQTTTLQQHEPDFARVRKHIQQQMAAQSVPSIAVAVVRGKTILWEEGFGLADRENHIKATKLTPFSLASVTKSITCIAIMMLQERRQLNLDHPVNEYLGAAKVHSHMWNP